MAGLRYESHPRTLREPPPDYELEPPIRSFLDLDLYKLTMGQFVYEHENYRDTTVKYEFTNRTKSVELAKLFTIDQLKQQLDQVGKIRINDAEADFLEHLQVGGSTIFTKEYINFLKNIEMPEVDIIQTEDHQYKINVEGSWANAIYWETFILSTVNKLATQALRKQTSQNEESLREEGWSRLQGKIHLLKDYIAECEGLGLDGPYWMEFGTRRRESGSWQEEVVAEMKREFYDPQPQDKKYFSGTSNVHLAMKLGLPAKGTLAHEMDMIFSGIYRDQDDKDGTFTSHQIMLDEWYQMYGKALSIALTDTYGSKYFFDTFTDKRTMEWNGVRQDSGDPFEFGKAAINHYRDVYRRQFEKDGKTENIEQRIDEAVREKYIVFSDGLDVERIIALHREFRGKIKIIFGWGTDMTNDFGLPTMSLVVKATEANGHGTCKLSDDMRKAIGTKEDQRRAILFARYDTELQKRIKKKEELIR